MNGMLLEHKIVDPFNDGIMTKIHFINQFKYNESKIFNRQQLSSISALYVPRYRIGDDPEDDPIIVRVSW